MGRARWYGYCGHIIVCAQPNRIFASRSNKFARELNICVCLACYCLYDRQACILLGRYLLLKRARKSMMRGEQSDFFFHNHR